MSLKTELEDILRRTESAVGAYIMDTHGLVVEKAERNPPPETESMLIEFIQGYRTLGRSSREIGLGHLEEMSLTLAGWRMAFRRINDSYLLIMIMVAGGSLGEAVYRLRRAAENTAGEFGD
jgi:predicted regulator of Ras-like GTPase activity (Roadblock/LC7/MglB family)